MRDVEDIELFVIFETLAVLYQVKGGVLPSFRGRTPFSSIVVVSRC